MTAVSRSARASGFGREARASAKYEGQRSGLIEDHHNHFWNPKRVKQAGRAILRISFPRRGGRVVEGARLESVFRGNSNVGSNPTLSAILESSTCDDRTGSPKKANSPIVLSVLSLDDGPHSMPSHKAYPLRRGRPLVEAQTWALTTGNASAVRKPD